jgi:hypothetical protein
VYRTEEGECGGSYEAAVTVAVRRRGAAWNVRVVLTLLLLQKEKSYELLLAIL